MEKRKRLPDAELAVMQVIWALEPPVTAAEIQQKTVKDWKATSVLTFLSRLTDKGFLRCDKEGRQNYYTPLISRQDYLERESRSFLERLCGGSVKNLMAGLAGAGALSERDMEELREFLDAHAGQEE